MTPPAPNSPIIRAARASDVEEILKLVQELAEYERMPDAAVLTAADLHRHLFCAPSGDERPVPVECLIAEQEGAVVGFALYFYNFSTWVGRLGIYLEDLYVRPQHRKRGIGRALLRELARVAVERGCQRIEWAVLDWNAPGIEFYKSLGARPLDDWKTFRLAGDAIRAVAEG